MRRPMVAGNWKMNKTAAEAIILVQELLPELQKQTAIDRVICPPFTALYPVSGLLKEAVSDAVLRMCSGKGAYTGK